MIHTDEVAVRPNGLASLIEDLRQCQLLDAAQLDELQARCTGPEELLAELLRRGVLTKYQAEQLSRGDAGKLVLGQYVILDLLGEGGMGQVFKGRHQRMKRLVAVKVIRKDTTVGPQAVLRFNKEIEAAAQLSHPNVVLAHDADEVDDTLFFVMEFVEGIDLGRLVHNVGALPVGAACDFIRQAALGLQHAHERGLVHRDIKPSNLLLTYAGAVVKILDLGLARLHQGSDESGGGLTQTGTIVGTPDFMSPEQGRDSRSADIRSDIYSLGCTLYYLLAGKVPYPEGSFTEKLLKHNMDEPASLAERRPEVPGEVTAVLNRMIAKRPADRYQTPREAAEALGPFAEPLASAECYRQAPADPAIHIETARLSEMQTPDKTGQPSVPSERGLKTDKASVNVDPVPAGSLPVAELARVQARSLATSATDKLPVAGTLTGSLSKAATDWKTLVPSVPAIPEPGPTPPQPAPPPRRRRVLLFAMPAILGVGFAAAVFAFMRPAGNEKKIAAVDRPAASVPTAALPTVVEKKETPAKPPPTRTKPPPTKKEIEKPPEPPPLKPFLGRLVDEFRDEKSKQPLKAAFTRDGRRLFAGWGDQVRLWDLDPLKPVLKPRRSAALPNLQAALVQSDVHAVAIAPDGHRVLIGTTMDVMVAGKVTPPLPVLALWDTDSANEPKLLEAYRLADKARNVQYITAVAFSPQGNRVLAGSMDRTVRLWDLDSGTKRIVGEHKETVSCVAFSPDGRFALSGGWDYQVILWDLVEKRLVHAFGGKTGHQNIVTCITFSPDGRYAVSGGRDHLLKLWDLREGKWLRDFEGHTFNVRCAAFSPDGKRLLSGGEDETIRLWSIDQVEPLARLKDHRKSVLGVAFSADGKYAVSIGDDNTVRRWQLPE